MVILSITKEVAGVRSQLQLAQVKGLFWMRMAGKPKESTPEKMSTLSPVEMFKAVYISRGTLTRPILSIGRVIPFGVAFLTGMAVILSEFYFFFILSYC